MHFHSFFPYIMKNHCLFSHIFFIDFSNIYKNNRFSYKIIITHTSLTMKLIQYVIFAILSLCLVLSNAREIHVRGKVDVTYYQYSDPRCTAKEKEIDTRTGNCINTVRGKYEKIKEVDDDELTVMLRDGGCGDSKAKKVYKNGKCTRDDFIGKYVRWVW